MSMTEIIDDMTHEMVGDSEDFEDAGILSIAKNQAYVQRDNQSGNLYVICPYCGKKNFLIVDETRIYKLPWKCKGSSCKKKFEVNV